MSWTNYSLIKDITEKYELKVRYEDGCGYNGHIIFEIFENNKDIIASFQYKPKQTDINKIKDVSLAILRDGYEIKKDEYQIFDIEIDFNNILSVIIQNDEFYSKVRYNFFRVKQFDASVFKIRLAAALNAMFQY